MTLKGIIKGLTARTITLKETGEIKSVTDIEFESQYVNRNGEQRSNRFIGTKFDDVDAKTLGEYMNTKKLMEFDAFFNVHEKDGRKFMSMRIYGIRVVV